MDIIIFPFSFLFLYDHYHLHPAKRVTGHGVISNPFDIAEH